MWLRMSSEDITIIKFLAILVISVTIIAGAIIVTIEAVNLIATPTVRDNASFDYIDSSGSVRVCQIANNEAITIKCLEPVKND